MLLDAKILFGNDFDQRLVITSCELTQLIAEIPALATADGQLRSNT
jgi:hypothetical protein